MQFNADSGGGGGGGGGGPEEPPLNCLNITFETTLNSPKTGVIEKLKTGDVLNIVKQGSKNIAIAFTVDGEMAGSISADKLAQLLDCMEQGFVYVAKVLWVRGGFCRVEVRAISGPK